MVFIKAGGQLRVRLNPDIDFYTRKVEIDGWKIDGRYIEINRYRPIIRGIHICPRSG